MQFDLITGVQISQSHPDPKLYLCYNAHMPPLSVLAESSIIQTEDLIITDGLSLAFDALERGTDHLFITGKAGTGKSTLLTTYRNKLRDLGQELVVLAPTGVAALNVDGQTIHSFFNLAPNATLDEAVAAAKRHRKKELFRGLSEIVIDEISMVRSDLLDCIDVFLQTVRLSPLPFGGVRMVFFGDLYQLPPVVSWQEQHEFSKLYSSAYFFGAKVMDRVLHEGLYGGLKLIELDHIFRQSDSYFIEILNAIRTQTMTLEHLEHLNARVNAEIATDQAIILTGRRDSALELNWDHLASLSGSLGEYVGEVTGNFPKGHLPTEQSLSLKAGARVMFVANDSQKRWVNGTLGTITKLKAGEIVVRLDSGEIELVTPHTWELSKMVFNQDSQSLERETFGSFKQLPVCVAQAITIHKSQGKTFDHLILDLRRGVFAHGQAYVALSRCRTLEGMSLTAPLIKKHVMMDPQVSVFMESLLSAD